MHAQDRPTDAAARLDPAPDGPGRADGATGDAAVDEAIGRLAGLDALPVREHVAVFDAVHAALRDRLADVEG